MRRLTLLILGALLLGSQICLADTLTLRNGDILSGRVQNETFEIRAPYSALIIKAEMVKGLFLRGSKMDYDEVQTINNDYFSGSLHTKTIEFLTMAGHRLELEVEALRDVRFSNRGVTREIDTALIFMRNGDKFSGRLMADAIRVNTDYAETNIQTDGLSHVGFTAAREHEAILKLNNGSRFKAILLEARLPFQLDSAGAISVCVGLLDSIQFNVKKTVVQIDPGGEIADQDGDGTPDARDACPDTACGFLTDGTGCRPANDADHDGVDDASDLCAGTPAGVQTNASGCWVIQAPLFALNKAVVSPESYEYLDEVVWILERNPDLRIEVQGHADKSGLLAYNQRLTQLRANAVVAYLVGKGVAKDRLRAVGYGYSRPKATNDTEAGRALNRRVEIVPIND